MKLKKFLALIVSLAFVMLSFSACGVVDIERPVGEENTINADTGSAETEKAGNKIEKGAKLVVHYLDVGQGDSEFIEFPNGKTMLIDAGESEMGDRVVNAIKTLGYSKIDYLVATHPHADHIGGLPKVFEAFEIGTVFMPNAVSTSKAFEKLLDAIENEDCAVIRAMDGVKVIDTDGLNVEFVAPVSEEYDNINDYSAVLMIKYQKNSFIFMGDAEKTSEGEITADVRADVIKVGHHGSKTASTERFISRVNPKYAIIEVGKDNSYGHPHNSTISGFNKLGTEILCTSELGDITVVSDGRVIDVK